MKLPTMNIEKRAICAGLAKYVNLSHNIYAEEVGNMLYTANITPTKSFVSDHPDFAVELKVRGRLIREVMDAVGIILGNYACKRHLTILRSILDVHFAKLIKWLIERVNTIIKEER